MEPEEASSPCMCSSLRCAVVSAAAVVYERVGLSGGVPGGVLGVFFTFGFGEETWNESNKHSSKFE